MERQLWNEVVTLIDAVPQSSVSARYTFRETEILRVYFWAVLHDRPVYWACQFDHWPGDLRPESLPTPSTMSRRLRRPELSTMLAALLLRLRRYRRRKLVHYVDGKPLLVRTHTRDPDAQRGWADAGYARGYKLHLIANAPGDVRAWAVTPLNTNEPRVAESLVPHAQIQGYLLGDGNYDTNRLHQVCRQAGLQLVAPRRRGTRGDLGHRKHDPGRLRCRTLLEQSLTGFGPRLYAQRPNIERQFGHYSSSCYGIGNLPPWVRRLHRVQLWVAAKLVLLILIQQRFRSAQ